jgi:hypothetical protein
MPALFVLGTFIVLPIFYAIFLAFQKVQLLGSIEYQFTGFRSQCLGSVLLNYAAALETCYLLCHDDGLDWDIPTF